MFEGLSASQVVLRRTPHYRPVVARAAPRPAPGPYNARSRGAQRRCRLPRPSSMPPPSTATAAGRRRAAWAIALLALAGLAAMLAALVSGSVPIDATQLGAALVGDRTDTATAIVLELRLPRAIAAFAAGGLLATAGALMQVLMRNPLADPYVLGISGGAAVAALTAILAGLAAWSGLAALG